MNEQFMEQAQALEESERMLAVRQAASRAFPDTLLTPDQYKAEGCERCDDPLPEFRKQRGLVLCTICQDRKERGR